MTALPQRPRRKALYQIERYALPLGNEDRRWYSVGCACSRSDADSFAWAASVRFHARVRIVRIADGRVVSEPYQVQTTARRGGRTRVACL